ncbi:hypothetical protein [Arsenicibacter rosenii]|uniref:Uncharacterized protein n=1 Tax=Arsenicibacter rosenii TaxID=1750698 RepID=A0A1S2VKV8_9BACT|nr:hypothetical protein [Arsenicibacter rosenii]OIN58855.1 hypothetical protein BLX24_11530 [Arsenicibacter rosenii]
MQNEENTQEETKPEEKDEKYVYVKFQGPARIGVGEKGILTATLLDYDSSGKTVVLPLTISFAENNYPENKGQNNGCFIDIENLSLHARLEEHVDFDAFSRQFRGSASNHILEKVEGEQLFCMNATNPPTCNKIESVQQD